MQQVITTTHKSSTLSSISLNEIVAVLKICNLGDSRFRYSDEQLTYWAKEIQTDFPNNLFNGLVAIIRNGIKGKYKVKNTHITLSVIYEWIGEHKKIGKIELPDWRSGKVRLTEEQYKSLSVIHKREYNQIISGV